MTSMTLDGPAVSTPPEQAALLLLQVAGFVGYRTVALGLRRGLIAGLAASDDWTGPDDLADRLGLDPFYVAVWRRSALAAGLCDVERPDRQVGLDGRYRLAPHMATLLLDGSHPAFAGALFDVLGQPEVFDRFEAGLGSGERLWWDGCSPEWIAGVAGTGTPYYTRLAPGGLDRVPELGARLRAGGRIVDTACGSGSGLVHLARSYPNCVIIGVDGDEHSLGQARLTIEGTGLTDRIHLVHSPLEELTPEDLSPEQPVTLVINNISMHECRDIDLVTANVCAVLEPGGWFVISDFPFPDTLPALRSVPGRIMCGVQFFEAQIDDQLLPRAAYDRLLARHGFVDIGHEDLTPTHALTRGRTPGGSPTPPG